MQQSRSTKHEAPQGNNDDTKQQNGKNRHSKKTARMEPPWNDRQKTHTIFGQGRWVLN